MAGAPWSHIVKDPARAAVVRTSVNLLALAAMVAWPFTPAAAERVVPAEWVETNGQSLPGRTVGGADHCCLGRST